ncbi:hypothetical protein [Pseudomonas sp. S2_D06]|jgi:hypothetical protein
MKKAAIALLFAAVATSGCTIRVADMTVASTKNYNINASKFVKGKRVTGEDNYPVIIFPTGIPNMKTAMDNAIQQDSCAVGLTDVVMSQLNHSFLFGMIGFRVEGDLVIDTTRPGCEVRA